ncbi:MAG: sigma-70 family RNA polymerase sigma factor [Ignavibacteria bacterium]|nr:sigma-70 family RNA polymerase sigma factor [Ignavibacteria bacterium]
MAADILYNSEFDLVNALKRKEKTALEYLYKNYSKAVFGIIFKILNSKELSEEILQDVFLKVWNNISTYDSSKGRLYTWLVRIAQNLSIDKLRTKDFKKNNPKNLDFINDVSYNEPSSDEVNPVELEGLSNYINKLDEKQRILIDMAYFKGFSQKEISDDLEIPIGTVKTRLRNAILTLRKLTDKEFNTELNN